MTEQIAALLQCDRVIHLCKFWNVARTFRVIWRPVSEQDRWDEQDRMAAAGHTRMIKHYLQRAVLDLMLANLSGRELIPSD